MKTYIVLILTAVFGFQAAFAQNDKFAVKVDGLGCAYCAYGLETKFKEVEGISKIAIDLKIGLLTYEMPAATAMTIAQVQEQVAAAGYTTRKVDIVRASGETEATEETAVAQVENTAGGTESAFRVSGSCEMCKARIEKAAAGVKGVKKAEWNAETQMLSLVFKGTGTDIAAVKEAVAKSGHDTDGPQATDAKYASLPGCCKYR